MKKVIGVISVKKDKNTDYNNFYVTMHSPRGANASFAVGAKDEGGGFLHDTAFIPEQEIFVGIKKGDTLRCFPFFKKDDQDGEEAYNQGVQKKRTGVRLIKYLPSDIKRTLEIASDTWEAPGIKFEIATPVDGIPEPGKANEEAIKKAIVPAIPVRITIDNSNSNEMVQGIFGIRDLRGIYSAADHSKGELKGIICADNYGFAIDADKFCDKVKVVADFGPDTLFNRYSPEFYTLAPMGGFIIEALPGEVVTINFVLGWYNEGFVTRGSRKCKYYYTNYFSNIIEVFKYAISKTDELWRDAYKFNSILEEGKLNDEQKFLLSQAIHSYYASTMLFDDVGKARWVVNEGSYMMLNTFDLTVDHLFYETRFNPWVVKNQLETYVEEYSYYDTIHSIEEPKKSFSGGIAFTHDQGVFNTFSPIGYSAYELQNKNGCLSYMTQEELTNWVLCAAVYFNATKDTEWLNRRKNVISDCLYSMLNRDNPEILKRDGIMDFDSDRCGIASEITTYDSLDSSLGQARRNLYLAVKCWASYLAIVRLLSEVEEQSYRDIVKDGKEAATKCANTIASFFDEMIGYIPAILDGKDKSAIIPAIEGLIYPKEFGMSEVLEFDGEFGYFLTALRRHFNGVFKDGACTFSDGGWRLSANSINSWMSKIFLCQHVARTILKIDFGYNQIVQDRAHANWWRIQCNRCPGIDQILWGKEYSRGFHYPRAITSILWLE